MTLFTRIISLALLLCLPSSLLAWGREGHVIIATIAEDRLMPSARKQVHELLGSASLGDVATWADEVRHDRPETSAWHYVDIPYDAKTYDPDRDCKSTNHGDCIIAEIARAEKDLKDRTQSKEVRAEALKFLVHFVGDRLSRDLPPGLCAPM